MIALLTGRVASKSLDRAIILAGGVGLEFLATPNTISSLSLGEEASVYTYLVVRQDALTLYGFTTAQERQVFQILMQVKGIGPKLGLTALSVLSPDELAIAVTNRDLATLQRIPGVGKKSGERMLIEIGQRLAGISTTDASSSSRTSFDVSAVIDALVNLGWSQSQAKEAVGAIHAEDTATALREALQYLGN